MNRSGLSGFVNISTDKAANPTSGVRGYTKLIGRTADRRQGRSRQQGRPIFSVRFGNVLGSRGSVLPAFREQAKKGGPITVTHPDITRYFMLVEEAALLVVQAGAIGRDGEVLVLDMGEPVKIAEVARRFAEQHHPPLEIEFTGLRPGEKLHEDLVALDEAGNRPFHPMITHVQAPGIGFGSIARLGELPGGDLTEALRRSVTTEPIPTTAR